MYLIYLICRFGHIIIFIIYKRYILGESRLKNYVTNRTVQSNTLQIQKVTDTVPAPRFLRASSQLCAGGFQPGASSPLRSHSAQWCKTKWEDFTASTPTPAPTERFQGNGGNPTVQQERQKPEVLAGPTGKKLAGPLGKHPPGWESLSFGCCSVTSLCKRHRVRPLHKCRVWPWTIFFSERHC